MSEKLTPKKPARKKPAAKKPAAKPVNEQAPVFWAKRCYIPGFGEAQGEVTPEARKAFLEACGAAGVPNPEKSFQDRVMDHDPIAKKNAEREAKRKAKLGLK